MRDLTEFRRFGPRVEPNLSVGDCMGSITGPIATDVVLVGIIFPTLVYVYDIEGSMQGICLKVIVPIGE